MALSRFDTRFSTSAIDQMISAHGIAITYKPLGTNTTTSVNAWSIEQVGALDPFADMTFVIKAVGFDDTLFTGLTPDFPTAGDEIAHDGDTWTVVKVRENNSIYEIRALKPEVEI